MRNNLEERFEQLKNKPQLEDLPKVEVQKDLLSFPNPTILVDLPSKGKSYPEGHPLNNKTYVEIKEMTAKEEDILTNKSYIRKGLLIEKLVESLLVDKSIPVSTLLVGDKNAIMVAARISAYGANYDVTVNCSSCGSKNILSIDLTEAKLKTTPEDLKQAIPEVSSITQLENGNILLLLPKTNWIVECKMMTGVDERKILGIIEQKKNKNDNSSELAISEQLKLIIVSINSVFDEEMINNAVDVMPAYDAKILRNTYQRVIPNMVIEKHYVCSSCAEEQDLEVPFTQEFFWPK